MSRLRVVLADFDHDRRAVHERTLADAGLDARGFDNGADLLEHCLAEPPEVVVCDALLPRRNGFEVVKSLKADGSTAAVRVVLTLDEDDSYGVHRARLCGADVILSRPFTAEQLLSEVEGAGRAHALEGTEPEESREGQIAGVLRALEGRARAENPLIEHVTDALTGLYNEAYTALKLADEFKKVRRFHHPLTCVVVALDDLGDLTEQDVAQDFRKVLNEVAGILLCESRDIDHLARSGVAEFACLLPHTDTPGALTMAERILGSIAGRGFRIAGREHPVRASAGIATFTGTGMEAADELIDKAREAVGASRQWGGNRCTVWSGEPRGAAGPAPEKQ